MRKSIVGFSFLLTTLFLGFTAFAANEDIIKDKEILQKKYSEINYVAIDRTLSNAALSGLYSEVKSNPTEDNLRKLIGQLEGARQDRFWKSLSLGMAGLTDQIEVPGIHGRYPDIPGTTYVNGQFKNIVDDLNKKRSTLADKLSADSENLKIAVQNANVALNRNIQANFALVLSQKQNQLQKAAFCANLPGNVRTVTAKAKWDAYRAVEKRNLWSAELAKKKILVTRAVLSQAQAICGGSVQSSYPVVEEASGYVEKTLKSLPRQVIEREICASLPGGARCAELLSNQYFLAYVSQVPRASLRNLHLYEIQQPLSSQSLNLVGITQEAVRAAREIYWEGHVGVPASGGGLGGSGGGAGKGEGKGNGGGGGGGGAGANGNGNGGGGNGGDGNGGNGNGKGNHVRDHGVGDDWGGGGGGHVETPEERAARERQELINAVNAELSQNLNQLNGAIESGGNLAGFGSDIEGVVNQVIERMPKTPDFAEELKKTINLQVGDEVGLVGGFVSPQPSTYKSAKVRDFQKIEAKLAGVETPQGEDAREAVKGILTAADEAQANGDKESSNFYQELAVVVADIGLSFTPGVSVGKDAYEALTGNSLVTGEELDGFSRGMAIVGVATVGASGPFRTIGKYGVRGGEKILHILLLEERTRKVLRGLKAAGKIEEAAVREAIRLMEKYGVKARAIFPGKSGKYVMIGQNMEKVREAKGALEKGAEVMIFDGPAITDAAKAQWKELLKEAKAKNIRIPPGEVKGTLMYKENKAWLEKVIAEGHTIVDLGNPANVFSDFYEMEREVLKEILNVVM